MPLCLWQMWVLELMDATICNNQVCTLWANCMYVSVTRWSVFILVHMTHAHSLEQTLVWTSVTAVRVSHVAMLIYHAGHVTSLYNNLGHSVHILHQCKVSLRQNTAECRIALCIAVHSALGCVHRHRHMYSSVCVYKPHMNQVRGVPFLVWPFLNAKFIPEFTSFNVVNKWLIIFPEELITVASWSRAWTVFAR
jgi:hypothetical protein